MNSELLQKLVCDIYNALNKNVGIVDNRNFLVAFSNSDMFDSFRDVVLKKFPVQSMQNSKIFTFEQYSCKNFKTSKNVLYTILIEGTTKETENYLKIIDIFIPTINVRIDFAYEKEFFIKKVLLDNIYISDIEIKAKNFNIEIQQDRVVFLIKFLDADEKLNFKKILEFLSSLEEDFAFKTEENEIVLIKNINEIIKTDKKYILDFANQIIIKMASDYCLKAYIGIGCVAKNLKDISLSYKQAKTALHIKEIFNTRKDVTHYNSLGISRLIYKMPKPTCEAFLEEILTKEKIKNLDEETIFTINKFFENNLNVSEASRKLFIHRNTLVYRLEKIKNLTDIDLRIFEQAIMFKLAIMIQQYLDFIDKKK